MRVRKQDFYAVDKGFSLCQTATTKGHKNSKQLGKIKSGYELRYFKKENSTLQEEFFVRHKDDLVPIEVKAGNNNSKSLSTLIKSPDYKEIRFGIKIVRGNIGFSSNICTFPHFCAFLIKDFLATFNIAVFEC